MEMCILIDSYQRWSQYAALFVACTWSWCPFVILFLGVHVVFEASFVIAFISIEILNLFKTYLCFIFNTTRYFITFILTSILVLPTSTCLKLLNNKCTTYILTSHSLTPHWLKVHNKKKTYSYITDTLVPKIVIHIHLTFYKIKY